MSSSVDAKADYGDGEKASGNGSAPEDVSYAIAIYPHMAEQDDECNVAT